MLHFVCYFSYELGRFLCPFTSPRYYDVTHFLTNLNENKLHGKCKIENERHFVCENFLIFGIFIEKITINYENHVNCQVTLHLAPQSPLGRPLGWVLLGTHLSHT